MRALILAAFLGGMLCAQETPPQTGNTEKKSEPAAPGFSRLPPGLKLNLERPRLNLQRPPVPDEKVVLAPGQPCAIPLKNVLPAAPQTRIRIFPPAPPDRFPIRSVPLPAPSCDDVKR